MPFTILLAGLVQFRLRLFAIAGQLTSGGRRLWLRLAQNWPWAAEITRLQTIPSG